MHKRIAIPLLVLLLSTAPVLSADKPVRPQQVVRSDAESATAEDRIDTSATTQPWSEIKTNELRRTLLAQIKQANTANLRRAIEDLANVFAERYVDGQLFLDQLAAFERRIRELQDRLARSDDAITEADSAQLDEYAAFRRRALIANPLVSEHPILYVVREQYRPDHHNTATLFQTGEINTASFRGNNSLKTIDFSHGGETTTILDAPEGAIRDPQVHFDGKKIIFSMRKSAEDDYHIHEINTDGSNLRQLTSGQGISDIDPLYLPDQSIVFSSTREPKFCMCNRHIMANLFRMEADGANIHQIGKSTLFEGHAALMADGRILYDRWEYVDRNFGDAQGLWTVHPDGTNHALYWGNNTPSPGGVIDAQPIPGSPQTVCIFGSCHDRPWGAMAIIDRRLGLDGRRPVVRTWPADAVNLVSEEGVDRFDAFKNVQPKYEDPYPLGDPDTGAGAGKYFLCSRMTGQGEQTGLYLVDVFGNELLLHGEGPGCFDPMPLASHPRPPVLPSRRDFTAETGQFFVQNVYIGTHMQGVEPGSVKYLRVIESPEKRTWTRPAWTGQGQQAPAMNWHDFNNKRILGTVAVEKDGSAFFEVPADTYVYFQLLDENGMMIQSMRSGTIIQPGELAGCLGCHDNRCGAPPVGTGQTPLALTRPPGKPTGWYGKPRLFSYIEEVQPVWDAACIECHDFGKQGAEKLILAGDRSVFFNASYSELWRRKLVTVPGAGPAQILPARSWGSHKSRLVEVLKKGHHDVKLSQEQFDRIVTWIDINAPYYPSYASAYPDNPAGRSPLTGEQLNRLSELTGARFNDNWSTNTGAQVSFDRPELSPCLTGFEDTDDPKYVEALAIIHGGRRMLAERPRADMPRFTACPTDQNRNRRYEALRETEQHNRQTIAAGRKAYDAR